MLFWDSLLPFNVCVAFSQHLPKPETLPFAVVSVVRKGFNHRCYPSEAKVASHVPFEVMH